MQNTTKSKLMHQTQHMQIQEVLNADLQRLLALCNNFLTLFGFKTNFIYSNFQTTCLLVNCFTTQVNYCFLRELIYHRNIKEITEQENRNQLCEYVDNLPTDNFCLKKTQAVNYHLKNTKQPSSQQSFVRNLFQLILAPECNFLKEATS